MIRQHRYSEFSRMCAGSVISYYEVENICGSDLAEYFISPISAQLDCIEILEFERVFAVIRVWAVSGTILFCIRMKSPARTRFVVC
jgi:hypothetical protein